MVTDDNDKLQQHILEHTSMVMDCSNEFGEHLTNKMDEIQVMSDKFQEIASGMDVMVGIGAGMQMILHGCSQLAEQNLDRVPGHMPYETLFVLYVNAIMVNCCETADKNQQLRVGRA
jgi:phosphomevalonate kinase